MLSTKTKIMQKIINYLALSIVSVFAVIGVGFLINALSEPIEAKYNVQDIKERELELKFYGNKSLLIDEMNKFIKNTAPNTNMSALSLLNICDKYGVDVRLALAQGKQESHFGTKGLAAKTNNIFNRGAFDGKGFKEIDSIYIIAHPNESIEPYVKMIKKEYLGSKKTETDLLDKFVNLRGSRYASNEFYEAELRKIFKTITTTTQIDTLLQVHYYYKKELGL